MSNQNKSAIIEKTEELCQEILNHPSYTELDQKVQTFLENDDAKLQYENFMKKQQGLRQKQMQGNTLTKEEIQDFEQNRSALLDNSVITGFLDAQQEIHKMQETITQYVIKTYELGRVPNEADFQKGACGPSCGCS